VTALPDITLCAADSVHPKLAARAIEKSMAECEFGDAILFSDVNVPGPFRSVAIEPLRTRDAYSTFILKQLASYVSTPFTLIVQWDGYVIAARAWRAEFTGYDYVGAVWPWHTDGNNVGNGGFSLRSAKLLALTASPEFEVRSDRNEDELICRLQRSRLERQHGVRFAPEAVAHTFSYERRGPDGPTFGFHGLFNMWRHVNDSEMIEIVDSLESQALRTREVIELLLQYVVMRKIVPALALFCRLRRWLTTEEVRLLARQSIGDLAFVDACIADCERWSTAT
jgi:hypothetical protein